MDSISAGTADRRQSLWGRDLRGAEIMKEFNLVLASPREPEIFEFRVFKYIETVFIDRRPDTST